MTTSEKPVPAEKAFAFLALLVVALPDRRYTADAGKWATAISALRERYGADHPDLFRYFRFSHMPRADSYSPQVSNFLAFLQFADAAVVHNPGFTVMEIRPDTRDLLRQRYESLLTHEDRSVIERMAETVSTELAVRAQG